MSRTSEDVAVQHLGAVGLVEPFDIGVVRGLSGLSVIERDTFGLRPLSKAWAMSSGPLSRRIDSGAPRTSTSSLSACIKHAACSLVSTSMRRPSRQAQFEASYHRQRAGQAATV